MSAFALLAFFARRNPVMLVAVGLVACGYGIRLIVQGFQGDTLVPGTLFTYLPRWVFIITGLLLQLPLAGAIWFLNHLPELRGEETGS